MGSAEVLAAPTETVKFVEDMKTEVRLFILFILFILFSTTLDVMIFTGARCTLQVCMSSVAC